MVSRAIAPTVMGCGRPRCCHDLSRARPPNAMVAAAKDTAGELLDPSELRPDDRPDREFEHVGIAERTVHGRNHIG